MTARTLARTSNRFEPSDQSLALHDLLSTAEIAALLHLHPSSVRDRAARRGLAGILGSGHVRYWTRWQVEQLQGKP